MGEDGVLSRSAQLAGGDVDAMEMGHMREQDVSRVMLVVSVRSFSMYLPAYEPDSLSWPRFCFLTPSGYNHGSAGIAGIWQDPNAFVRGTSGREHVLG
jgi:hypothetical protein